MSEQREGWADTGDKLGPMGYGDPDRDLRTNLLADETALKNACSSDDPRFVCMADYVQDDAERVAKLREKLNPRFGWDEGFGCWACEDIVYGTDGGVEPGPQEIGNCVGESHGYLLAGRIATEILLGQGEEPLGQGKMVVPYIPYSYGIGRCNRNGVLGSSRINGDGSLCSWQISATMAHGILPSDTPGLTSPPDGGSASNQRSWGRNDGDILNQYRPKAIVYDLLQSVYVESADETKRMLLEHLVPLQICSGWGFAFSHYDGELAVYRASGSWSHSMQLVGWFTYCSREYVVVRNQWGRDAHHDPGLKIPRGCFTITADTCARWIADAEVATIAEILGRPTDPHFPH